MLPKSLKKPLQEYLRRVGSIHEKDLTDGWGRVRRPESLDRKYPNAPTEWRWQWAFPQENRWRNLRTGEEGRHHVDESILQKAFKQAVRKAGLVKRATCHTLRHYLPFRTMSGNARASADLLSPRAKPLAITRHSLMWATDRSGRPRVDRRVYSDPLFPAAGIASQALSPSW